MGKREITEKEWAKLRSHLGQKARMIFDVMWFTGERIGAIVQLQQADIFDAKGKVREIITFRRGTRKGKDRSRLVCVHDSLKEILQRYPKENSVWMFPGNSESHLQKDSAMDALERAKDSAGLGMSSITSHSFRHAFANRLHRKGYDLALIQQALGHADIKSTRVYISDRPDAVAAAIKSL